MIHTDTIAAIATAMGNSGIGIVRISGQEAVAVADRIFKEKGKQETLEGSPSHTIHYGYIYDGDQVVDEVLVMLMRGPRSFTAEDTVEIDCHGGMLVTRRILETVLKAGARLAEPGEFTKRAFLNGRIDLSQAEAVIDVINAKNEYALKSSVGQLRGSVSKKIRELREKILYEIAFIESALDDPEHISLEGYEDELMEKLDPMIGQLESMVRSADNGKIVTEGIKTVILGKPNAGKSSLMNVLVGEERAIVTDIAGTTRDILEEQIRLHGITLNVIDTAGIRETEDIVEQIGVSRARQMADQADLIIYVVDGSRPLDENDDLIMNLIRDRKAVVLLNKTDLKTVISEKELSEKTGLDVIAVSAREETGIDQLENKIKEMFYEGDLDFNDEVMITNVRHKTALSGALESLKMVKQSIENQMPEDFLTIDLMDAYEQLGTIIGEAVEDDLVNEIFYIPFQITIDLFPFGILKPPGKLFHPFFNLRAGHGTRAQSVHHLPHHICSPGFQISTSLVLLFINVCEVLPENIMSQLRAHGLNGFLHEITVIIFGRIHHQMHMRMMPLIMKRSIPPQVLTVNLHVPAQHSPFGTQQRHPLFRTVITDPCRIFSPQGYHMSPDHSLVSCDFLLYSGKNHWLSCVREQPMLSHSLHTGTVCNIVHIVFTLGNQIQVLFQRTGDKLRSISDRWP